MHADEIRFLFAYDRSVTRRLLSVLDGLDPDVDLIDNAEREAAGSGTDA